MSYDTTAVLAAMKTSVKTTFASAMQALKNFWDGAGKGYMTVVPSSFSLETYAWVADATDAREWLGSREVDRLKERSFQVLNKTYEKTFGVGEEDLEDNKDAEGAVVTAGEIGKQLAYIMGRVPDVLRTYLMQNGHAIVGYDGQYLYDTDHPTNLDSTGAQSNYEASGFALTQANFVTARARMMGYKAENGVQRPFEGTVVLEVPPALETAANTIVQAEYGSGGATNVTKGFARVLVNPRLAGQDTTWYLWLEGTNGAGPTVLQERRKPRIRTKTALDDDNMFWDREAIFGGDARYGAAPGMWWKTFKAAA